MAETSVAKTDLRSTDVRTKIRPSSRTSSSVYVFVPTWRRNSALGAGDGIASPASRRILARIAPVLGNSVLLRNADRKRTRRCVPSAVLIWPADRNHAKIIAQRHPSCESRLATARRRRHAGYGMDTGLAKRGRERRDMEEASEQPDPRYFVAARCCDIVDECRTAPQTLRMRIGRGSASLRDSCRPISLADHAFPPPRSLRRLMS